MRFRLFMLRANRMRPNRKAQEHHPSAARWSFSTAARWSFFTLLCWFLSGFGAFTLLPWGTDGEPYSPVDAAYFQAQILTTVGYGDLPPHNAARVFTTIYVRWERGWERAY